jgi:23S rRNA pseudouridine2605 synthase
MKNNETPQRIAKTIAESGICSRREAEKLINLGKVFVNGKKINKPTVFVNDNDKIVVDGKLIKTNTKTKLFIFNKPKGVIVSTIDPQGRRTIYDIVPQNMKKLLYIGRLDFNTEGLLLLTNNGKLKRFLELPVNKIERIYKVKVHGNINNLNNDQLKKGITLNNIRYGSIITKIIQKKEKYSWIEVKLTEGKNREIRKVMEFYNLYINDLIRIKFGPFTLSNLKHGEIIKVEEKIINLYIKNKGIF